MLSAWVPDEIGREFRGAVITTLFMVVTWVLTNVQGWLKKRRAKDMGRLLRETTELGEKIKIQLAEIGTRCGASRAFFAQYHNGEYYVSGSSLMKQTRSQEWCATAVRSAARQHQCVLISLALNECQLVEEPGPSYRLTHMLPAGYFRRVLEAEEVLAVARCAVYQRGKIIGFIGLDFLAKPGSEPEAVKLLPSFCSRIEMVYSEAT